MWGDSRNPGEGAGKQEREEKKTPKGYVNSMLFPQVGGRFWIVDVEHISVLSHRGEPGNLGVLPPNPLPDWLRVATGRKH